MDQQKRTIIGVVGRDPELKITASGKTFTRVSIANNDEPGETKWYQAVFWEGAEGVVNNLDMRKGATVQLTGEVVRREYQDRDGTTRTEFEMKNPDFAIKKRPPERVQCQGTIARDPELKMTESGRSLLRVAVVNNSDPARPMQLTAVFWNEQAQELSRDLKKGMVIKVSGELATRTYQDRDGSSRTAASSCSPVSPDPVRARRAMPWLTRCGTCLPAWRRMRSSRSTCPVVVYRAWFGGR